MQRHGVPDPNEYNQTRFARWLRTLMISFYSSEEVVVADLLCQRAALLRDTVVAQVLRLPDRQVRQALERRLVPEGLVERLAEGTGTRQQTFYRISHLAVRMTDRRLQAMEDAMAAEVEEEYRCPRCEGSVSSLEAVALPQRQLEDGAVAFSCGSCGEALRLVAESATARHERLQRFRQQCRELLDLTRELRDMQVPLFEREERPPSASPTPSPAPPPAPKAGPAASSRPEGIDANGWFTREVLGGTETPAPAKAMPPQAAQSVPDATDEALREAVRTAHSLMMEERARRLADARCWASAPLKQPGSDAVIMVQGQPHPLMQVRDSEDLQDRMTDEEYQHFFDLERQFPAGPLPCGSS